uniref:cytochrome P450 3A11-like n=1 Tax=Styela clava TaxID=7725 RepID=UPI0019394631|nr:cytochrome P450 3A11-like [Styela clava]
MTYFLEYLSFETWILVGFLLLLARYYIHREWSVLSRLQIPYDPPSMLNLGNLRQAMSNEVFTYDLDHKEKYGLIWGFYALLRPRIVCHDLEILQQIFIKEFSSFPNRSPNAAGINGKEMQNALIESKDGQWKRMRKTITPTFSTSKLKQMLNIMDWCVKNTVSSLQKKIEQTNGVFSAKDVFAKLSLDVICSSAFSTDVNSQDESKQEPQISVNARNITKMGNDPTLYLSILFPWIGPKLYEYSRRKPGIQFLSNVCKKIIQQRNDDDSVSNRVDLLRLMLDSKVKTSDINKDLKKGLSEIEITGNSIIMILAGYETTSTTMSFLAYNLAQYPEVQRKLQAEIDEMYRTKGVLDYDAVNSLQYLDMCINESIRLYTPIPRTYRTSNKEITLSGFTIPYGMVVVVPIYALCHDPEHWNDPMEFQPERMENISEMHPMLFQPFGSGPRNCIGMRFALMEVKIAFCKLLHEFTFEPTLDTPKPPLNLEINGNTSRSEVNFNLRVVPRES